MLPMNPSHYRQIDEKHGWAVQVEVHRQGDANFFEPKIACLPKPQLYRPTSTILESLPHRRPYLGARRGKHHHPQAPRHDLPPVQRALPVKSQTARAYRPMPRLFSMRPAEYLAAKKWTQPQELTRVGDATLFEPQPPQRRSRRTSVDMAQYPPEMPMPHPSLLAAPMSSRISTRTVPEPRHVHRQSIRASMRPFDYMNPTIGTPQQPASPRSPGSLASHMSWRSSHNFETYAEHMRAEDAPRVCTKIPETVFEVHQQPEQPKQPEEESDVEDLGEESQLDPTMRLQRADSQAMG